MKTALSLLIVCAAVLVVGGSADTARAQGVHVGVGRLHVDVGNPHHGHHGRHGYHGYGRSGYALPQQFGWNTHFQHFSGGGYGHARYQSYYQPGWGSHYDWHDTTHYDYHPGQYVPHYNHYDYVPGHYDLHRSGHWDAHH
jgi:hypothetical protein